MRAIVTGAAGWIGKNLQEYLRTDSDINLEYLIAIDRVGVTPTFGPSIPEYIWVSKNLDEASQEWWRNLITDHNIDTIFYLESFENDNLCAPDNPDLDHLNKYQLSDFYFIDYLNRRLGSDPSLNVLYMSTDKIYYHDTFPTEKADIVLHTKNFSPMLCDEIRPYFYNYSVQKAMMEIKLQQLDTFNLRIIRPFGLTDSHQNQNCPLFSMARNAIDNLPIELYKNGDQGLAFTHLNDLIAFLVHPKLFDTNVELTSNVINFCRTQNYVSASQLVEIIKNKTESDSLITYKGDFNPFDCVMQTPQVRNMNAIYKPIIPIEIILEEIIYVMDPLLGVEPLVVTESILIGNFVTLSGTADPEGSVLVYLGTGDTTTIQVDASGVWSSTFEVIANYIYPMGLYAVTSDNRQYMSLVVTHDIIP